MTIGSSFVNSAFVRTKKSIQKDDWPTLQEQRRYPKRFHKQKPRFRNHRERKRNPTTQRFDVGEIQVPTNNMRNSNSDSIIVPETQESQMPKHREEENGETNNFLFHSQGATSINQNNA